MENFTIEISERQGVGKSECNRCRKDGFIPGVAYHKGADSVAVKVPHKEFVTLGQKAALTQVFTFKSDAKALDGKLALVKEVKRDYVKGTVLHVDFITLKAGEEVHVDVPLKLVGESPGVKNDGGILTFVTHKVSVSCLPKDIPTQMEIDISGLRLCDSIHAYDLQFASGVKLLDDPHETIVSIVASRGAKVAESKEGEDKAGAK